MTLRGGKLARVDVHSSERAALEAAGARADAERAG
jgi:hypothetical protein